MKEKLISVGYLGNYEENDIELFLKEKYRFNIRNIDCYLNYGGVNDHRPSLEYIPDRFFHKDYIENETESECLDRSINLALDLILKIKQR